MIELQAMVTGRGETVTAAWRDAKAQKDALNGDGQAVTSFTTAPAYKDGSGDWLITLNINMTVEDEA